MLFISFRIGSVLSCWVGLLAVFLVFRNISNLDFGMKVRSQDQDNTGRLVSLIVVEGGRVDDDLPLVPANLYPVNELQFEDGDVYLSLAHFLK